MGKSKKKKFIDKKNASTYHLLHRSQRDVAGEQNDDADNDTIGAGSTMVLWPSPHNKKETNDAVLLSDETPQTTTTTMSTIRQEMAKVGIVDDEYDYEQHMKPITGSGILLDAQGKRVITTTSGRSDVEVQEPRLVGQPRVLQEDVHEVSRQLESIALTADCMDDDIAQALFGNFDEHDFEEILDDFCLTAAQEPPPQEEHNTNDEFDYDAHIRSLMERAAKQERDEHTGLSLESHHVGKMDNAFFSHHKPLHGDKEDDDEDDDDNESDFYDDDLVVDNPGIVPALDAEEERALCEKFEQTLAEYDSDDVGDLDEECEDIRGDRSLGGDGQLDAVLDDFLEERKDEIFMKGTRHLAEKRRTGGSSFAALVGRQLVHASDLEKEEDVVVHDYVPVEDVLQGANETLANPTLEPPTEEVLIDGKSYFSERTCNPWDCESILSTYSNLDNNPITIESKRRRKKKQKRPQVSPETLPEDEPVQIKLSSKTGLPLGVLSSRYDDYEYEEEDDINTTWSRNKGEGRKKNETPQEKKARKLAVKREREVARMQKKMMKEAIRDEFAKRGEGLDGVTGKSVFRYS